MHVRIRRAWSRDPRAPVHPHAEAIRGGALPPAIVHIHGGPPGSTCGGGTARRQWFCEQNATSSSRRTSADRPGYGRDVPEAQPRRLGLAGSAGRRERCAVACEGRHRRCQAHRRAYAVATADSCAPGPTQAPEYGQRACPSSGGLWEGRCRHDAWRPARLPRGASSAIGEGAGSVPRPLAAHEVSKIKEPC